MKCLIFTEPDDTHALLVKLSLEKMGHEVSLLFTADQPTKQRYSVFIDETSYQLTSYDKEATSHHEGYEIVWFRRPRKPYVPKNLPHPDDYAFVSRENVLFYESLTTNIAPDAWWVNPKEAAIRANSKLFQLKIAKRCGLSIPKTLCSNNPHDIRSFLLQHEDKGVIYKPLCSHFWFELEQVKASYTTKVFFLDLPSNSLLQQTPGLFQREVKKSYELRITCFGDYLVAAKLNSQAHEDGEMDWRAIPLGEMQVEPYELPEAVAKKIRVFMRKMGLVFGSLDMIVTPEKDYVFLEINEQGQFLWLEDYNPDFKLLDTFVQFLTAKTRYFKGGGQPPKHQVTDYNSSYLNEIVSHHRAQHVDLNTIKVH